MTSLLCKRRVVYLVFSYVYVYVTVYHGGMLSKRRGWTRDNPRTLIR